MSEIAISLKNVSKCFKRYSRPVDRLKEILLPGKSHAQEFWALSDIKLEVMKGETLGIIGQNGSGKSTLLQIIAGVLTPTRGKVSVNGRVSALLELGSGFNPEFTGRQNVFFNGRLLGLSQRQIEDKFDEIAKFADIGDFIDEPVKTYSSGMFVRLAFAVAVNVEPDILIIDEALAVGDGIFVHRCMAKIREFQERSKTIIFVSHDVGSVARICTISLWMQAGKLVSLDSPQEIMKQYQAWVYQKINNYHNKDIPDERELSNLNSETLLKHKNNPYTKVTYVAFQNFERFGTGRAELTEIKLLNKENSSISVIYPDEDLQIKIKVIYHDLVKQPIVGAVVLDKLRTQILVWNTYQLNVRDIACYRGDILSVTFSLVWPPLYPNNYSVDVAIADGTQDNHEMLDWIQNASLIKAATVNQVLGLLNIPNIKVKYEYVNK